MKKKLSSLYCTFVPCKSFSSDFFIVEKTIAFYEKILFSEEKAFAIFRFTIYEGRNFRENGQKLQKLRKILPAKVSTPKVCNMICIWNFKTRKIIDLKLLFQKLYFHFSFFLKKVFLKFSLHSQENTSVRVSFLKKFTGVRHVNLLKFVLENF